MTPVSIIIADDHQLFIDGLKTLLQREPWLEVSGTATGGRELLSLVKDNPSDIVLMDINMPGLNGLEAAKDLHSWNPAVKIIMLSTYGEDYLIQKAMDYGASGYLLKTSPREKLLEAIRAVAAGGRYFPKQEVRIPAPQPADDSFVAQFNLTGRELDIIQHIKQGLTTSEIAEKLNLSPFTVKTHRKNIASKLKVKNFASLMKVINDHNL